MQRHLAILGGGPAGYVAASHAAAHGARVTLIDPKPLGGTCLNQGCVPTKVLVESCALFEKIKHADAFGIKIDGSVSADWAAIMRRAANIVSTLGDGIERLMENRNVTCIREYGRLLNQDTVCVQDQTISPDAILICTGSAPLVEDRFNVDGERIGTSDDLLRWDTLPRSMMIVGSGIIACEFAFILDSLGVNVTILASGSRLLSAADKDISIVLQREMRKRGINFKLNCRIESVVSAPNGVSALHDGQIICTSDRALIAVGRQPNSRDIGLENAGIFTNARGEIKVDDVLKTNVPKVYAVGDVNGRSGLAHAASAQAKLAVDHALGRHFTYVYDRAIPVGIFTNPEIGSVGRTEEEVKSDGVDYAVGKFDLRGLGRAHALGEISGFVKVLVCRETGQLLGLHVIGPHAAEVVHEGALVLQRRGKAIEIFSTVHAHPTISEGVLEAIEDALGQATHKPISEMQKKDDVLQLS